MKFMRDALKFPLVVAPMAGGPTTVELVVAASEAGALGSYGAAYSSPTEIRAFVAAVRARTAKPFAINLFVPHPVPSFTGAQIERAQQATASYRRELGLPAPDLTPPFAQDFAEQLATVLELRPAVLSYVFGLLDAGEMRAARARGIFLVGTATSLDEAQAVAESGADAVVLQGIEAGGHRGIFDPEAADPEVPTLKLLRDAHAKLKSPLIAAGGIMNRTNIQQALALGAEGVQMGTAFLNCREAGTSEPYRAQLSQPSRRTRTTRVFSGRLARGIENRFMLEMKDGALLPFPVQNSFTRDLRRASAAAGRAEFLSLWCGTGGGSLWTGPAVDLIRQLFSGGGG